MIVRTWRGRAAPARPDDYPEHFRFRVLPALKEIEGFLGASLLRHDRPDEIEFLVMTRWTSLDAIRAFAGEHPDRAVVEPEAAAALVSFDATVRHYEVVEEAAVRRRSR
jgi:heme-degrading monooxygenase HmoA